VVSFPKFRKNVKKINLGGQILRKCKPLNVLNGELECGISAISYYLSTGEFSAKSTTKLVILESVVMEVIGCRAQHALEFSQDLELQRMVLDGDAV
jgi:hypothetical protein